MVTSYTANSLPRPASAPEGTAIRAGSPLCFTHCCILRAWTGPHASKALRAHLPVERTPWVLTYPWVILYSSQWAKFMVPGMADSVVRGPGKLWGLAEMDKAGILLGMK